MKISHTFGLGPVFALVAFILVGCGDWGMGMPDYSKYDPTGGTLTVENTGGTGSVTDDNPGGASSGSAPSTGGECSCEWLTMPPIRSIPLDDRIRVAREIQQPSWGCPREECSTIDVGSGGTTSEGGATGSGGTIDVGSGGTIDLGTSGNGGEISNGGSSAGAGGTIDTTTGGATSEGGATGSGGTIDVGSGGTVTGGTTSSGGSSAGAGGTIDVGSGGTIDTTTGGTTSEGGATGTGGTIDLGTGGTIDTGTGGTGGSDCGQQFKFYVTEPEGSMSGAATHCRNAVTNEAVDVACEQDIYCYFTLATLVPDQAWLCYVSTGDEATPRLPVSVGDACENAWGVIPMITTEEHYSLYDEDWSVTSDANGECVYSLVVNPADYYDADVCI